MEKRKILQFSITSAKGGQTQYILNSWKHIDKEKFQFDFLTFDSQIGFADELKKQGCQIFYMPCRPQENIAYFRETLVSVLKKGYDTLHIGTGYWNGFEIEEIAKEYGVPQVIIHAHSSGYQKAANEMEKKQGQTVHYEMRKLLKEDMATDFVACSREAAEWIFGDRIPRNKIKIMPNAIDTSRFAFSLEKRKEVRAQLGLEDKFVIGHVGRIELVKNHEFLIRVFSEIVKIVPEAALVLVGDGKLREKVEGQIRDQNLQENVKVLGKRDDTDRILQAMDVYLLPSLFEGFPISLVEAQTAGLPCIVSDLVTKEAAVTMLVSYCPLTIGAWTNKLNGIYELWKREKGMRRSMCKQMIDARYEIRNQVKELEKLYERV